MWKEVTSTEPVPGSFYKTKIEPMLFNSECTLLYLHPKLGWLQPGIYNKPLFTPTHYWDGVI